MLINIVGFKLSPKTSTNNINRLFKRPRIRIKKRLRILNFYNPSTDIFALYYRIDFPSYFPPAFANLVSQKHETLGFRIFEKQAPQKNPAPAKKESILLLPETSLGTHNKTIKTSLLNPCKIPSLYQLSSNNK